MKVKAKKTKTMTNTNETSLIKVDLNELDQVNCFVFLGRKFNQDSGCTDDVKARLA